MKKYLTKPQMPAMLGVSIQYYDVSLYGYMAPVMVEIFMPNIDKINAYFVYFFFELFAGLGQVLGAKFFGHIADTQGRKKAIYFSLLGTSLVTFTMSLMPTYNQLGTLATTLFLISRILQRFFLGGEYNGGAIYCLEHEKDKVKQGLISGIYCAFTVIGILCASFIATIIYTLGTQYFRIAYAISFFLAIITFKIRASIKETPEFLAQQNNNTEINISKIRSVDYINKNYLYSIASISVFFAVTYGIPTRIFNVILPMTMEISTSQLMAIDTMFLILYMFLLILFGWLSDKLTHKKIIIASLISTILLTYPLLLLVDSKTILGLIIAKTIFYAINAAFIAPFHVWSYSLFPVKNRYSQISVYYNIGKCFGVILLSSSVKIFEHYQTTTSLGIILILTAIATLCGIIYANNITVVDSVDLRYVAPR